MDLVGGWGVRRGWGGGGNKIRATESNNKVRAAENHINRLMNGIYYVEGEICGPLPIIGDARNTKTNYIRWAFVC